MSAPVVRVEGDGSVKHALRRLSVYVVRNKRYYAIWALATFVYVGAFIGFPMLVGDAIQAATEGAPREEILTLCLWIFGVVMLRFVFRYYSRTMVFDAAREVEYEMRNDLFAHFQRLPQSFYFEWRTGDLMSRCVNDLNSVRMLLGPGLLSVMQTPILFIGVIAAMAWMNWKLALLVMIPFPLFVLIARLFGAAMHARSLAVQVGLGDLSNQVQEAIAGIPVVKAYAMEDEQRIRFQAAAEELLERQLRFVRVNAGMPMIVGLLPAAAMCILLVVGGQYYDAGRITIGDFFAFSLFIFQLIFPTFIMGWTFALVQRGAAAMQRIDEVLSVVPSIADADDSHEVDDLRGEIEFRGLSFRYGSDSASNALEGIDLQVPAGSSVGIVGPMGSGKSTLASLIPRIYEVERGQLFLDGVDVNDIPLNVLRRSIAMVPQDSFLFSMSLADNIAYGLEETRDDEVQQAAERAQLHKDVDELPHGYATMVGERGVMLSGGQRQRTALARALALDPSILILDDTLSAVDAETESAIQQQLEQVFDGLTVVVVASRVSTVTGCDQIVVLDQGRIVEQGTHEELMALGGLYVLLNEQQQGESRGRGPDGDVVAGATA